LLDIKDIETFQFLTKMRSISSIVVLSIQLLVEAEVGISTELLTKNCNKYQVAGIMP